MKALITSLVAALILSSFAAVATSQTLAQGGQTGQTVLAAQP